MPSEPPPPDAAAAELAVAAVRRLLGATNLALVGRVVAVLGFGPAGRALAATVRALGGRTVVVDDDPLRAAAAQLDGHAVAAAVPGSASFVLACERSATLEELPADVVAMAVVEGALGSVGAGVHVRPGVVRVDGRDVVVSEERESRPAMPAEIHGAGEDAAAGAGAARIAWARERMPVLARVAGELRAGGTLAGRRVGISLVLDPTTAVLALALHDAGAAVAVHAPPAETHDDVAAALAAEGVAVFARSDGDGTALADALLDWRPELLADDGAHLIRRAHGPRRDALTALAGAAEETTSGVRALRALAAAGELAIPCLAVDDARTKRIADNGHATGQSCVLAVLDATGLLLAGRAVAVAGYGPVGRSVARHAAALGARVTVSELDAHRALEALHDGHAVAPLLDACAGADVLLSATGVVNTVTLAHLRALPDGAVVAVAGGVEEEVEVRTLRAAAGGVAERLGPHAEAIPCGEDGRRRVVLVAGGGCVNVTAAEGNPIEAMDCSLALQALALDRLAREASALAPGVHRLPAELDARVAELRLAAAGMALEEA